MDDLDFYCYLSAYPFFYFLVSVLHFLVFVSVLTKIASRIVSYHSCWGKIFRNLWGVIFLTHTVGTATVNLAANQYNYALTLKT